MNLKFQLELELKLEWLEGMSKALRGVGLCMLQFGLLGGEAPCKSKVQNTRAPSEFLTPANHSNFNFNSNLNLKLIRLNFDFTCEFIWKSMVLDVLVAFQLRCWCKIDRFLFTEPKFERHHWAPGPPIMGTPCVADGQTGWLKWLHALKHT